MKKLILLVLALLCTASLALADGSVRVISADATSWIAGKDPTAYMPQSMIDGDETTAFQFSTKKTPLGQEYVYFYFSGPSDFSSLWIKNGFWKISDGKDQYLRNSRVKMMTVSYQYSGTNGYADAQTVSLPDDSTRADWTKVSLGSHQNVTSVRFLIQEIYQGSKYPNDVCISEVMFVSGSSGSISATAGELYGLAKEKLATRSGPGTTYAEKGTYKVAGQYIKVLARAWDERNSIWWVKCEIPYRNEIRVLWTGYKRFDSSTLPLDSIPIDYSVSGSAGSGTASGSTTKGAGGSGTATGSTAKAGGEGWKSAYRQFVSSGVYLSYIHNPDSEFNEMLNERDTRYDSLALHDIDRNGTPELIVLTAYGPEQADVFTWNGSGVTWIGTMGGDNFFQGIFYYQAQQYPVLIALTGGPAMNIDAYSIQQGWLLKSVVGYTPADSEGEIYGIQMYNEDANLYSLLYGTLLGGQDQSRDLNWVAPSGLQSENDWSRFLQSAT